MCGFSDACSTLYQEMVCWVGWQTKSNHTIKGSKERASKLNTEAMRYLHRHRQCFNCLGSQELALHTQILDRIKYIAVGCIASQNQSNIIKPRQSQSLKPAMPSASKLRHARTHTHKTEPCVEPHWQSMLRMVMVGGCQNRSILQSGPLDMTGQNAARTHDATLPTSGISRQFGTLEL